MTKKLESFSNALQAAKDWEWSNSSEYMVLSSSPRGKQWKEDKAFWEKVVEAMLNDLKVYEGR